MKTVWSVPAIVVLDSKVVQTSMVVTQRGDNNSVHVDAVLEPLKSKGLERLKREQGTHMHCTASFRVNVNVRHSPPSRKNRLGK